MKLETQAFLDAPWVLASEGPLRMLAPYSDTANVLLGQLPGVSIYTFGWRSRYGVSSSCLALRLKR